MDGCTLRCSEMRTNAFSHSCQVVYVGSYLYEIDQHSFDLKNNVLGCRVLIWICRWDFGSFSFPFISYVAISVSQHVNLNVAISVSSSMKLSRGFSFGMNFKKLVKGHCTSWLCIRILAYIFGRGGWWWWWRRRRRRRRRSKRRRKTGRRNREKKETKLQITKVVSASLLFKL